MSVFANVVAAGKKHPYWLVGGVVVVIVLFELKGSSKTAAPSGNTGVTTLEEDPNQIAANTALQQTQAALNATTIQANDAVQANADTIAGQVQMAGIESSLYSNYFNTVASVQNTQVSAAQEVNDRSINAEQQVADQANTNATALANQTAIYSHDATMTALANQHDVDVYNGYAALGVTGGSSAIEASAVGGSAYAQAENTAIQSGPLGSGISVTAGEHGAGMQGFLQQFGAVVKAGTTDPRTNYNQL